MDDVARVELGLTLVQRINQYKEASIDDGASKNLGQVSRARALTRAARVDHDIGRWGDLYVLILVDDRAELQSEVIEARIRAIRLIRAFDHQVFEGSSLVHIRVNTLLAGVLEIALR